MRFTRKRQEPTTSVNLVLGFGLLFAGIVACNPGESARNGASPPAASSSNADEDARLKVYLDTFSARSDFVDDVCVERLCEVSFLDLPAPFLIRRGGIFAPHDYYSLWVALEKTNFVAGKRVLDLGTGAGPFALIAAHFGAEFVVGTDVNGLSLIDAERNAARMGWSTKSDFRLVSLESPQAYSVVQPGERFDIIISNPPELDEVPRAGDVEDYSEKDPGYQFVLSMFDDLAKVLAPNGQLVLLYAGASGVPVVQNRVRELGLDATIDLAEGSMPLVSHTPLANHEDYGSYVPLIRISQAESEERLPVP